MKTMNRIAILLIIAGSLSCGKNDPNPDTSELSNIHIGLYVDNGAAGIDEVESMLGQTWLFLFNH